MKAKPNTMKKYFLKKQVYFFKAHIACCVEAGCFVNYHAWRVMYCLRSSLSALSGYEAWLKLEGRFGL